jgi:hypothetical protein
VCNAGFVFIHVIDSLCMYVILFFASISAKVRITLSFFFVQNDLNEKNMYVAVAVNCYYRPS